MKSSTNRAVSLHFHVIIKSKYGRRGKAVRPDSPIPPSGMFSVRNSTKGDPADFRGRQEDVDHQALGPGLRFASRSQESPGPCQRTAPLHGRVTVHLTHGGVKWSKQDKTRCTMVHRYPALGAPPILLSLDLFSSRRLGTSETVRSKRYIYITSTCKLRTCFMGVSSKRETLPHVFEFPGSHERRS